MRRTTSDKPSGASAAKPDTDPDISGEVPTGALIRSPSAFSPDDFLLPNPDRSEHANLRITLALGLVLSLSLSGGLGRFIPNAAVPPTALLNANVTPSGTLRAGVLTLALEAKPAMWYPEGS